MFKRFLLLATAFFFASMGAPSQADTMSSDAVDSQIFAPPIQLELGEISEDAEIKTQASAYFAPPNAGDGFTNIEEEENKRRKSAMVWTTSALALGSFFSSNSEAPSISVPSVPLEPGPGVAPVPELNSGALVLLSIACLGIMGVGRKQFVGIRSNHLSI